MWGQSDSDPTASIDAPTVIGGAIRPPRREQDEAGERGAAPAGRRVRVALLDDHELLLDSVGSWLRQNAPDLDVVLSATSWLQLVHSPSFPTDLVLLDVQLKESVSIEARVRTCRAAGARVIVLTGLDTDDMRERALRAGAAAFISKSRPLAEVLATARAVMAESSAADEEWRPLPAAAAVGEKPRLSVGEEEALRLYVSGRSTSEVADAMNVRFETAKTYLRRVREKYQRVQRPASRKSELMRRAAEDGYLD